MATAGRELDDVLMRTEIENDDAFDDDEGEEEEEDQKWEDWNAENEEEVGELHCLFCESLFSSCNSLFDHCSSSHCFDFYAVKRTFSLDFYGCFKLINYIRSQVAKHRCWCCGITCKSGKDLQDHLHEVAVFNDNNLPWVDEKYLQPFVHEDPLLYSFDVDDVAEDEGCMSVDKKELLRDLNSFEKVSIDDKGSMEQCSSELRMPCEHGDEVASTPQSAFAGAYPSEKFKLNGFVSGDKSASSCGKQNDKQLDVSSVKVVANQIKNINKNYFGSYSSFGIHREMISDKVRTDAYRQAILENPSLVQGAVVMDVGCGTGILSLFAAQAGATRVIAVEASEKMASVAAQIAKDNGLLRSGGTGKIEVVQGMVEELETFQHIQLHSVDVIVSEWMGYCLLYESMLSSVLFARDRWLKPGGAILPDTATMFVAGFGRGGTSLPFWENVYGFNMSCIGKEVDEDAARVPIVDVIDGCDLITNTEVLQTFDMVTMKYEDMDFTSEFELEPKFDTPLILPTELESKIHRCHGVVLWFETGFTRRFCKEMPTVLSTSPCTPKTHWSQTILTFREPITIAIGKYGGDRLDEVGTDSCPAAKLQSRISIVRAAQHRTIDISMELSATGLDGRKRNWPAQIFNLY